MAFDVTGTGPVSTYKTERSGRMIVITSSMVWPMFVAQLSAFELSVLALPAVVAMVFTRRFIHDRIKRRLRHLPPGPTPLPLVGSALSMNSEQPWLTYTTWAQRYGDVTYARLLDTDVIVLQTYSDATELLEKRSHIYSDRPFFATSGPYGHDLNFGFARYGPYWKLCRRIFHQTFRAEAAATFRPMQLRRARQLIINFIDNPQEYPSHFSTFTAAVAMSAVYGYEPQPREDPMVKIIDDFCKASVHALNMEKAVLIKTFPFLLSVPEWIPVLSRIRREANIAYALSNKAVETPYQWVRERMEADEDIVPDAMVFDHMQHMETLDDRSEYDRALKSASMTAFLASAETTSGTLMSFTLAMVKTPHVWKRAQAEIDAVIGTARLPELDDRPSLPYVDAIIRETLRWHPVLPMGAAHSVTADDNYKGYYIPSGTVIFANTWAITRDAARYPDPEMFIPERFLDSDGMLTNDDPADYVFGFGRRACPGKPTADASLWCGIATLLATFDFGAVKDASGHDIEFEATFIGGLTHHPLKFPCDIVPRAHITREALQQFLAN